MDSTPESEMTQADHQIVSSPTDMSACVYEGKNSTSTAKLTDQQLEKTKPEMTQAAKRVRELYASGVPFFTKGAITDLARQLDRAREHHEKKGTPQGEDPVEMLSLQGLDGKTVQVENEIGTVWPAGKFVDQVMVDSIIEYQTYQHLVAVNTDPVRFSPKLAYCPLRVEYHARNRDKTTKEFFEEPTGLTFEAAREAFDAGVKTWEGTEECTRLTATLLASAIPDKITKVIAFACCTVSSLDSNEHRITQHALMLTIKDILKRRSLTADVEIGYYAQDPAYTDVDRAVLEVAGIRVLNDPHGFLNVDDSSVVISFSPDIPVRQIVADVARPAILLWDKVRPEEETSKSWSEWWQEQNFESIGELEGSICDPESSRLREMICKEYVEIQELQGDAFGDSCVYVRRS